MKMVIDGRRKVLAALLAFVMIFALTAAARPQNAWADEEDPTNAAAAEAEDDSSAAIAEDEPDTAVAEDEVNTGTAEGEDVSDAATSEADDETNTAAIEEVDVYFDFYHADWDFGESAVEDSYDAEFYFSASMSDKTVREVLTEDDYLISARTPKYKNGDRTFKGWALAVYDTSEDEYLYDDYFEAVPVTGGRIYSWNDLLGMKISELANLASYIDSDGYAEVCFCPVWQEPASDYLVILTMELQNATMWFSRLVGGDEIHAKAYYAYEEVLPRSMNTVAEGLAALDDLLEFETPIWSEDSAIKATFKDWIKCGRDDDGSFIRNPQDRLNFQSVDGVSYTADNILAMPIPKDKAITRMDFGARWEFENTGEDFEEKHIAGTNALLVDANGGVMNTTVEVSGGSPVDVSGKYIFADGRKDNPDVVNRGSLTLTDPVRKGYVFQGWAVFPVKQASYYNCEEWADTGDEVIIGTTGQVMTQIYTVKGLPDSPLTVVGSADANAIRLNVANNPSVYLKAMWGLDETHFSITTTEMTELTPELKRHYNSMDDLKSTFLSRLSYLTSRFDFDRARFAFPQVSVRYRENEGAEWTPLSQEEQLEKLDGLDLTLQLPAGFKPEMSLYVYQIRFNSAGTDYFELIEPLAISDDSVFVRVDDASLFAIICSNKTPINSHTLAGAGRYDTCAAIAKELYKEMEKPSAAVFVTGDNFPDALTANGLAGAMGDYGIPVLMIKRTKVPDAIKNLLVNDWKKSVKTAYVVGGGFETSVFNDLKALGITTVNNDLKGTDRYKTADAVLKFGMDNRLFNTDTLVVATGAKAADALSMSSYCYANGYPMVLANKYGVIKDETKALLNRYKFKRVIVAGAESCCKTSELEALGYTAKKGNLIRLWGEDRYATSVAIAAFFASECGPFGKKYDGLCLAPGGDANFPDALVGGMLAGFNHQPMLLVGAGASSTKSYTFLEERLIDNQHTTNIYALGFCKDPSIANRIRASLNKINHVEAL
ncbi:MAG: cell wall-binding repeat-containing protein [Lachnospiraceae bacterium]|nr:cell wall-binding repeat-containing protein [Lachnospiraceae bacterium]